MDCYIKNCSENQVDASEFEVPAWKRILDITCIIIAAPLIVPLMIVIALVIWYVSPGLCFFARSASVTVARPSPFSSSAACMSQRIPRFTKSTSST